MDSPDDNGICARATPELQRAVYFLFRKSTMAQKKSHLPLILGLTVRVMRRYCGDFLRVCQMSYVASIRWPRNRKQRYKLLTNSRFFPLSMMWRGKFCARNTIVDDNHQLRKTNLRFSLRSNQLLFPPILLCACAGGPENSAKLLGVMPTPAGSLGILGRRGEHQFENPYRVYSLANREINSQREQNFNVRISNHNFGIDFLNS
jgi:hypothetical protein